MNQRFLRAEAIFAEALERPGDRREAFVQSECSGDLVLAAQVMKLLAAESAAGQFLCEPTVGHLIATTGAQSMTVAERDGASDVQESGGRQIGPYKLLEPIGEGGFGTVYMAEQREPVQRRVALKIIKPGMDTRQVIARFEAERQALAMMDHPNIAKVHDAGATEAGRPYFVMELVKGVPITAFCDDHRLAIRQRLELFVDVCHAVQHAHTKGIIHRDIKPTNVLVTTHDDKAVPKVIDFGIAKATDASGRLTDKTLFTEFRQLIGTPEYMSPEQATLSGLDVDTRSDVYSLGVLLYELLTGVTPFDRKQLRESSLDEMRRIIREVEPPKPSTRVSSLAAVTPPSEPRPQGRGGSSAREAIAQAQAAADSSAITLASVRQSDPKLLTRQLRGDLDWIVMKCLEKVRTRRYETANGLAMDVGRYLAAEPVVAAPPSSAYRVRKFVWRHRRAALAAGLVSATLLIATVVSIAFGISEARQRKRAQDALLREEEQRKLAQKSARETKLVAGFQGQMLRNMDVEAMGRGIQERFREQLRVGLESKYVGNWPNRQPRTSAEVAAGLAAFDETIAPAQVVDVARQTMDEYMLNPAAHALETQFPDQPLVQAAVRDSIGVAYITLGRYEKAEQQLRAALEACVREAPDDLELRASILSNLGVVLHATGRYEAAEPMLREALALQRRQFGDEQAGVASMLSNLALLLKNKRHFAEAEPLYREALAMHRRLLGDDHVLVASDLNNLGVLRRDAGDYAAAESLFREALALLRRQSEETPEMAGALNNLATLLKLKGDYAAAEPALREALALRRRLLGNDHPDVAGSLLSLSQLLNVKGNAVAAEEPAREALMRSSRLVGHEHPDTITALDNLANILHAKGDAGAAESMQRDALERTRKLCGDMHLDVATSLNNLAVMLSKRRAYADAEPLLREALSIRRKLLGDEHPEVAAVMSNLAVLLRDKGDLDEAETLLRQALAVRRNVLGQDHPHLASTLGHLATLLVFKGEHAAAEPLYREALAICEEKLPPDHPQFAGSRAGLAAALVRMAKEPGFAGKALRDRLSEAEALLTKVYDALSRVPQPPNRLFESVLQGLAELYDVWHAAEPDQGHDAKAAQWRTRLAEWQASTQPAASERAPPAPSP